MSRRGALITLVATLVVVFGLLALTQLRGTTPRLGLDLQGGFAVVLEAPEGTDPDVLDEAVAIMRRRIEALGGVQEPEISVVGDRTVEVQLPGVTDRERALAAVGTTGQLEFRPVLAVSPVPGVSPLFYEAILDNTTTTTGDFSSTTFDFSSTTTAATPPTTTTVAPTTTTGGTSTTVAGEPTTTTTVPFDPKTDVELPEGITWCDEVDQPGCVDATTGLTLRPDPDKEAWLATDFATGGGIVYHTGPARIVGADLRGAQAQFQSTSAGGLTGQWLVVLEFTEPGGARFTAVTKELAAFPVGDPRRQFAIVLDGTVQSAPAISPEITPETGIPGTSAVITLGSSTDQEAEATDL
ncbi:MAG TPA: hypothetical protein VFY15_07555, partial [Acidimicrobiia bacterium]|nr:hypothetical protein [Acidimicrobiia bacterium]